MHIYICICARALICRMIELWMEGAGPTRMEILLALEICINRPLAWRAEGQVAAPLPCCVHCTERPSWLRDLSLVVVTATPDPFGRAERELQAYRSDGLRPVRIRGEPATTHSVASRVAVSLPHKRRLAVQQCGRTSRLQTTKVHGRKIAKVQLSRMSTDEGLGIKVYRSLVALN